jgi:CheY-like chemotaxis protein
VPAEVDSFEHEATRALRHLEQEASAVAHELNNILTVVRTYTYFARQATSSEQRTRDLRVVAAAAERGTTLTDWLASTAEHEPHALDQVSAKDLISSVAVRLQLLVLPGTHIETHAALEDSAFHANHARLKHVVVSLVLSASQLLPGGTFDLGFERRQLGAKHDLPLEPGAYVVLVIHCRAAAERAPQPESASLTGDLSGQLVIFTDLLASMNGGLAVASPEVGVTRFELHLPAASGSPVLARAANAGAVGQSGTILVVEDDSAIRLAMRRTLANARYSVLEASDGPAAQEILTELGQTVSLVVSDSVLPRGGGPELFAWVRARFPDVAFLLISGREREGEAKASQLGVGFLGKPFYPAEFLAAVNRALLASQAAATRRVVRSGTRPVVVLVDDDSDIRDSFERLLSECDLETYVAKSALHALQILGERHVDAVVTDQVMPGLDGIGLLELVYERFPSCTRILCTGHPGSEIVIDAVNRGHVHRVLTKTMHAVALRDEIERAVLEAVHARESRDATGPGSSGAR